MLNMILLLCTSRKPNVFFFLRPESYRPRPAPFSQWRTLLAKYQQRTGTSDVTSPLFWFLPHGVAVEHRSCMLCFKSAHCPLPVHIPTTGMHCSQIPPKCSVIVPQSSLSCLGFSSLSLSPESLFPPGELALGGFSANRHWSWAPQYTLTLNSNCKDQGWGVVVSFLSQQVPEPLMQISAPFHNCRY